MSAETSRLFGFKIELALWRHLPSLLRHYRIAASTRVSSVEILLKHELMNGGVDGENEKSKFSSSASRSSFEIQLETFDSDGIAASSSTSACGKRLQHELMSTRTSGISTTLQLREAAYLVLQPPRLKIIAASSVRRPRLSRSCQLQILKL